MAQITLTFVCFLLALIFCQEIQFAEGRHLKLERAKEFPKLRTYKKILKNEVKKVFEQKMSLRGEEYPTVKAANANLPPPTAPTVAVSESMPPPPRKVDDFRPTAPGHSPGVGHSLQN